MRRSNRRCSSRSDSSAVRFPLVLSWRTPSRSITCFAWIRSGCFFPVIGSGAAPRWTRAVLPNISTRLLKADAPASPWSGGCGPSSTMEHAFLTSRSGAPPGGGLQADRSAGRERPLARQVALIGKQLQTARAANDGSPTADARGAEEAPHRPEGSAIQKDAHRLPPAAHEPLQILSGEVRDAIPEAIDP